MKLTGNPLSVTEPNLLDPAFVEETLRRVIEAVLDLAGQAWGKLLSAGEMEERHRRDEVSTRGLLYKRMERMRASRCQFRGTLFRLKTEVGSYSSEEQEVPDGSIDIEVIHRWGEDFDFRIECKRVSSSKEDHPKYLAREYINEGVLRFVTDKYGRGHKWAAMFAFAVDGNAEGSSLLIKKYVETYKTGETRVCEPWRRETLFPRQRHLFRTGHHQGEMMASIRLLHLFLPFPRRS